MAELGDTTRQHLIDLHICSLLHSECMHTQKW